jgi:hypothetical protein
MPWKRAFNGRLRMRPRRRSRLPEQRRGSQWLRSQAAALKGGREEDGASVVEDGSVGSRVVEGEVSRGGRGGGGRVEKLLCFLERKPSFLWRTIVMLYEQE